MLQNAHEHYRPQNSQTPILLLRMVCHEVEAAGPVSTHLHRS